MSFTHRLKSVALCTLLGLGCAVPVFSQVPSLAPSAAYYMTAETEFGNETFTIIRDGRIEEQFYFVPAKPHVAIETKNGKSYPVFQLLSYQRKQPDNTLKQGAILQLSVQMGISQKTEDALLKLIKNNFPLSDKDKKHRLSPIPMKEATIAMYNLDGSLLDSAPIKEGVAPIFGNQQYPFMLTLTDLGSDVLEALSTNRSGLPVIVTYTFQGMTEPGGFKVEVDWDASYHHFSTDTKLRAKVGYAMLGANLGADFSTIRDEMISKGMIKVSSLSNEAMSPERIDAAMNPVLALVTAELFENIKAPAQISPASAKELAPADGPKQPAAGIVEPVKQVADAAGEAASAASTAIPYVGTIMKVLDVAADIAKKTQLDIGASFALKDAKFVKKGKFTYTYDRQAVVERKTSFGAPIGIGSFDKKIQDACITVLPPGNWESAYFMLPPVGDPQQLGFKQMSLTVTPVCGDVPVSGLKTEAAIFNKGGNPVWTDKTGKEASMFLFPLKAIYASAEHKANPDKFKFKVSTSVVPVNGASVNTTIEVPMFDGDMAMSPPSDLLKPVIISADCIDFGPSADEVYVVKGALKADRLSFNFKFDQNSSSQGFLIPKDTKSVKVNLQFISKTGKKFDWANNGKELTDLFPDLDIMLFDSDWQQNDADGVTGIPEAEASK